MSPHTCSPYAQGGGWGWDPSPSLLPTLQLPLVRQHPSQSGLCRLLLRSDVPDGGTAYHAGSWAARVLSTGTGLHIPGRSGQAAPFLCAPEPDTLPGPASAQWTSGSQISQIKCPDVQRLCVFIYEEASSCHPGTHTEGGALPASTCLFPIVWLKHICQRRAVRRGHSPLKVPVLPRCPSAGSGWHGPPQQSVPVIKASGIAHGPHGEYSCLRRTLGFPSSPHWFNFGSAAWIAELVPK